jgi:ribonucleoside-triphosphate reductase
VSLSELKKYTFVAKYASYFYKKKRRENWVECVERSEKMMLDKYKDFGIDEVIKEAYSAIKRKEVLGSQRVLQFAGEPIFKHNARLYNCTMSYLDRPRFFQECVYLLLCGCGTGFSVQKHHIDKLPKLVKKLDGKATFVIPDTIEGWADAIGVLVNSYFDGGIYPQFEGKRVYFDYTKIRPLGSKLSYTTGKAPGPEPLKNSIEKIRKLLDSALENKQTKLKPIHAYDIVMHASDCVLSGGIRRSATICLFSQDDEEMMSAKTGNWFTENPQRGRSNNSVILLKNKVKEEDFKKIFEHTKNYGEPGIFLVDSTEHIGNPCGEVSTCPYYTFDEKLFADFVKKNGDDASVIGNPEDVGLKSGWQFCNLSTANGGKCDTREKFLNACKQAAVIGTLQAGFTIFNYLGEISQKITEKEALLGVSITGIMENPEILLDPAIQREGAELIKKVNQDLAKKLGINPAARCTVVKPEGTSSCVLGTSSGIHPHHAKRYFRRIQANRTEPLYQYFKEINPLACESSVWSNNDTDDVATFCIEVPDGAKTKNQVSALELLKIVQLTKKNWIESGTTDYSIRSWLRHNVSNTITVKPNEWDDAIDFIFKNQSDFCGISLISDSGDKDYPQAPFTKIFTPNDMVKYYGDCSMFVSGLIERSLELYEDNLWKACDILLGLGEKPRGGAKVEWMDKCKSFSDKYLGGDLRKFTYLMKDVHNWKLWLDLHREYKNVNYEEFFEDENEVEINHGMEPTCAGGACQIIKT